MKFPALSFWTGILAAISPSLAGATQVPLGDLPPGKSLVYTYDVVIQDPLPSGVSQVSAQVSLAGANFATRPSDDPETDAALDATVTRLNANPTVNATQTSVTVNEGDTAMVSGIFSDPDGDAVILSASPHGTVTPSGSTWSWSYATTDDLAPATITVSGVDGFGGSGSVTFQLTVNNVAPSFEAGSDESLPLSSGVFARGLSFIDPGADQWSGTVDYGDGTVENLVIKPGKAFDLSHTYTTDGSFVVSVTLDDDDGGSLTDSFKVNVNLDNPPTFSGYAFRARQDHPASIGVAKILAAANDIDGDALSLDIQSSVTAQSGSVVLTPGILTYTPRFGYTGADSFQVVISDGRGGSVVGNITVLVESGTGAGLNQIALDFNGSTTQIVFAGIPGTVYTIQRSTNLSDWTDIGVVAATGAGVVAFEDTTPPRGSAFYRTIVGSAP